MPYILRNGLVVPPIGSLQPNLASSVAVKNKRLSIDQNDALYGKSGNGALRQPFTLDDAPAGLTLDNRQSVLNVLQGALGNRLLITFT